jgi:hypothetical protein
VYVYNAATGVTRLVSHDAANATLSGNAGCLGTPSISDDGNRIAYISLASDLISGGSVIQNENVYLFDNTTGTNTLVSHTAASAVTSASTDSSSAVISGNGNAIAFASAADDLVTGQSAGTGITNVFLYTVMNGTSALASGAGSSPTTTANGNSDSPSIDATGDAVAFRSDAANLVTGQSGPALSNVFIYNTATAAIKLISHAALSPTTGASGASTAPQIDGNGSVVAYQSAATNLVANESGGAASNVFAWFGSSGVSILASGVLGAATVASTNPVSAPVISRDPVVFFSVNGSLIPSTSGVYANSLVEIRLSFTSLPAASPAGTLVGTISIAFPEGPLPGLFTPPVFSLPASASGPDNARFTVSATQGDGTAALLTAALTGQSTFTILVQAQIGNTSTIQQTFTLSTSVSSPTPSVKHDKNIAYLDLIYSDLLNRSPDTSALAAFSPLLDGGSALSAVANPLAGSQEFHTDEIVSAYERILKRLPDSGGLSGWLTFLGSNHSLIQLEDQLYGSVEYFNNAGNNNTGFVTALYKDILQRPGSSSEIAGWVSLINAGALTPLKVATAILQSSESYADIVIGMYQSYLRRTPAPPEIASDVSFFQGGGTYEQLLLIVVSAPEYYTRAAFVLNYQYVVNVYEDVLGRAADTSGLQSFTAELNSGTAAPIQIVQAITSSQEYRTDVVENLYSQYLHRAADPTGLTAWLTFLQQGGTGEQVAAALVASPEFFADQGNNNTAFVSALYEDVLQRAGSPNEVSAWVAQLASGTSKATVSGAFFGSDEYHRVIVNALYERYLKRTADPGGLSNFAAALDNKSLTDEGVAAQLTASLEFFQQA